MPKVTLYMAASLNGMVARKDGKEDFLSDANWQTLVEQAEAAGAFVVGRRTLQSVADMDGVSFETIDAVRIVVSGDPGFQAPDGWEVASSPRDALGKVQDADIEHVILAGGAELNSSFVEEGLLDEVILNIEPTVIGEGISIFSSRAFEVDLRLLRTERLAGDIVQLRYAVEK